LETVAGLQRTTGAWLGLAAWGESPGAEAWPGSPIRLDIIANRDHIANGSGRSKRGSATGAVNRRQGGSKYE
jgi:hypothetical protein